MNQAESQRVQHTSGPWDVFHASHGSGKWTIAVMKGRKEVIAWTGFDSSDFPEDALANARLIAAAPELAEALKHAIYRNHSYSETCDGCLPAANALKKAGLL